LSHGFKLPENPDLGPGRTEIATPMADKEWVLNPLIVNTR